MSKGATGLHGALALAFMSSGAGQEPEAGLLELQIVERFDIDCMYRAKGGQLRAQLADRYLSGQEQPTKRQQARHDAAAQHCVNSNRVSEEEIDAFLAHQFMRMLYREFEYRIRGSGFDFDELQTLLLAERDDPNFDLVAYVDARPELFRDPIAEVTADQSLDDGELESWMSAYLGFHALYEEAAATLVGASSVQQ